MRLTYQSTARPSLLLVLALSALIPPSLHSQQKRRVAIASFNLGDDAKIQARNSLGIQSDLGRDLSDQLLDRLVNDGKFILLERAALDKFVTPEILRSNSDGFDPATAAKLGKLAGADSVIIGTITQLTVADVPTGVGGTLSVLTGGNVDKRQVTINVTATARVIDTSTAVVISSATGSGQSMQKTTVMKDTKTHNVVLNSGGTRSGNGPMHDAMLQAINMMATQLEAAPALNQPPPPPSLPTRLAYSSTVADVSGDTLILKVGTKNGVQIGDVVEINRVGRVIPDPDDPKKILKTLYDKVGTATITEADESTATATFSGSGKPKLKDSVSFKPKTAN